MLDNYRLGKMRSLSASLYVEPGFVSQQYDKAVRGYSDPNASMLNRAGNFLAATAMAPALIAEELGRGIMNIPSNFVGAAPLAAQAGSEVTIAADSSLPKELRITAGLSAVRDGAFAILDATAPVALVAAPLRAAGGAAGANTAGAVGTGSGGRQTGFISRGDALTPDVIFNEGLQPRGTNTDLYRYAIENENRLFAKLNAR